MFSIEQRVPVDGMRSVKNHREKSIRFKCVVRYNIIGRRELVLKMSGNVSRSTYGEIDVLFFL